MCSSKQNLLRQLMVILDSKFQRNVSSSDPVAEELFAIYLTYN